MDDLLKKNEQNKYEQNKKIKTRKRKTSEYGSICKIFGTNLNELLDSSKKAKKDRTAKSISKKTGASETSVGKWLDKKALPTVDQLYVLADFYNVSIDHLLSRDKAFNTFDYENMSYWDAFQFLFNLTRDQIISSNSTVIQDHFLKYLVDEAVKINLNHNISAEKKNKWYKKVEKDYSIRVFNRTFLECYFDAAKDSLTEIVEYETYVNCAKALDAWRNELDKHSNAGFPDTKSEEVFDDFSMEPFFEWLRDYEKKGN